MDYKDTLLMPKTAFEMRGKLPTKEPKFQKRWQDEKLYEKMLKNREGAKPFVLHDGPPYGRIVTVIVPYTSMIFNTQHKAASFLAVSA